MREIRNTAIISLYSLIYFQASLFAPSISLSRRIRAYVGVAVVATRRAQHDFAVWQLDRGARCVRPLALIVLSLFTRFLVPLVRGLRVQSRVRRRKRAANERAARISSSRSWQSTGDHVGDDATRFDSPALALVPGHGESTSLVMCLKEDAGTSTCVEMTFVRLSWGSYS